MISLIASIYCPHRMEMNFLVFSLSSTPSANWLASLPYHRKSCVFVLVQTHWKQPQSDPAQPKTLVGLPISSPSDI